MSIVLNEYEWAEQMIKRRELGNKPSETLTRIAKYYLENKYSKSEIREKLDAFIAVCNTSLTASTLNKIIENVMSKLGKYPIVQLDSITVYRAELAKIDALPGKQIRRLAFTLLCVAKYKDLISPSNNHWATSKDKDIMQMANINTSIRRQSLLFAQLRDHGLIRFSKMIDNLNVQVTFIEDDGETALYIHDFRNLGYQYLQYCGEPYFTCVNCGLTVKEQTPSKGRRQKYCPHCAVEIHTKQKVESVMRSRRLARH